MAERLHRRAEWALYDRESDTEELTNLIEDPKVTPVLECVASLKSGSKAETTLILLQRNNHL